MPRVCSRLLSVAVLFVALSVGPAAAQDPPGGVVVTSPPTAQPRPAPGTAGAAGLPVLPVDAQRLLDQLGRDLIQQLQTLQDMYTANRRPDDAAAVRAQIKLLQKATGITDEPATSAATIVNMATYRDRVGQTFVFTVTGSADQPVWGTDIYTDDTRLEGAAVHAGVLRSGQTGEVYVTVLPGQAHYEGSKKNGIESADFGPVPGSYRVGTGPASNARPTSIANFRGRFGEVVIVPVTGATTGSVWGSDIYTDDSSLAAAAVHAGILQPGEFGFVSVTILGGQARYSAATKNGIASQEYGEWQGSIRLAAASQPWVLRVPEDVVDASGLVSLPTLRKQVGLSFSLQVVGTAGPVRGSDVYTDDSSIAAAAVHAGVLRAGEKGYVKVTILPGQEAYSATEQNGVKSGAAGAWSGSFRVDKGFGGGPPH